MVNLKPVRVFQSTYGTYRLDYKTPDGCRRRPSAGRDRSHAERMAALFTTWLLEGKDPEKELKRTTQECETLSMTIKELYSVFMERHGTRQSSKMQELYETCFRNLCRCEALAKMKIPEIAKSIVQDYMHLRVKQDKVSAATVNREASLLQGMLNRAMEWGMLTRNPLQGLKLFKEAGKREVHITPSQIGQLLNELSEPLSSIVQFAVYSGLRKDNILGLRIEDIRIDPQDNTWSVELVVKGGRRELIPLCDPAVEVLQETIGDRQEGYVFVSPQTGTRYKSIHKVLDKAIRKVGLTVNGTKLRFHDFRHIFATWLHNEGVSLDTLRVLLGHRSRRTTDRYATLDKSVVRESLAVMPQIRARALKLTLHTRNGMAETKKMARFVPLPKEDSCLSCQREV